MNTVIVTRSGADGLAVHLVRAQDEETHAEVLDEGPKPIAPELKELAWGAGAFVVFALLMRYFLYPRLKQGMDARYNKIRDDHEGADAVRVAAQREVADYQAALAGLKAEAAARIDAARQVLEAERATAFAAANARISDKRAVAADAAAAEMAAARTHVEDAVADVAGRATELVLGQRPSDEVIRSTVSNLSSVGVGS